MDLLLWPQIMQLEEELQHSRKHDIELKNKLSTLLNQLEPLEIAKGVDESSNKVDI